MPTLKKLNEDTIKITSKLLKKNEDFSPISPEFIKDLRDKTLLQSHSLKLSISDYKLMCNDEKVLDTFFSQMCGFGLFANQSEAKFLQESKGKKKHTISCGI